MKLLIVSQYYYPEQFGVNDISSKLASLGHDVTVLTGLPNYPMGKIFPGYQWEEFKKTSSGSHIEVINNVKVIRCRLYPRKQGKLNLMLNYFSYAFNASRAAFNFVKQSKKDGSISFDRILVTQYSPITMAIPAIILKKKLIVPMILYCFDLWPESIVSVGMKNHGFFFYAIKLISQYIYKNADHIITSSKNFDQYLREKLRYAGPITHIPMYAEDIFLRECRTSYISCSKTCDFVFAGNVGKMQSIETILKAAAELKERIKALNKQLHAPVIIHIVGDGSSFESNINLAKELDILIDNTDSEEMNYSGLAVGVFFHGRHPIESMPRFYDMADAMLITLKKDDVISSTLPNKIQTYMAAGKPILAAIDGETSTVINNADCGLVCEAEDHLSLAENLYQFACLCHGQVSDLPSVQQYGKNSRKYYEEHFSSENFMKSLLQVLK